MRHTCVEHAPLNMAKSIPENDQQAVEAVVHGQPSGLSARQIADSLPSRLPFRTLQFRLRRLVENGRLEMVGQGKRARYIIPPPADNLIRASAPFPLARASLRIVEYLKQPLRARARVGFKRAFLDSYQPNVSAYLPLEARGELERVGRPPSGPMPSGTYARQILQRLLIDLSWNSSRLEGNTYTLLDTQYLLELGREAEGKDVVETQMIVNHKDAISFLVDNAVEIGLNRYTIRNLHAILATHLMADLRAPGRLRQIPVGIEGSVFDPLDVPRLIEEGLDQILTKASAIEDPFEQSFFLMVHLLYLQPFENVNKRVSRLAANIPFIQGNLSPLSFVDVPRESYVHAMMGVYELNDISLLRDMYTWAYERSALRYAAARQTLGDPDYFRIRHQENLRRIVGEIVRTPVTKSRASDFIRRWTAESIDSKDHQRFRQTVEGELLGLDMGNSARYRVTPSEFEAWQQAWIGGVGTSS